MSRESHGRTRVWVAVLAIVILLGGFAVQVAQAQAPGQKNRATLKCKDLPPGVTATVTWLWTRPHQLPPAGPFTLSCKDSKSSSTGTPGNPPDPGRPADATDYHRTISFTDAAGNPTGTPCSTDKPVTPGFAFSDKGDCTMSPEGARFHLKTHA